MGALKVSCLLFFRCFVCVCVCRCVRAYVRVCSFFFFSFFKINILNKILLGTS